VELLEQLRPEHAPPGAARVLKERFKKLDIEVELGFGPEQTIKEVERCLNCDIQTVFEAPKCIECDACIDICPTNCLTITANGDREDLRQRLKAPRARTRPTAVRVGRRCRKPAASWSRTKTSACIAACAPSAARPRLGHAEVHAPHSIELPSPTPHDGTAAAHSREPPDREFIVSRDARGSSSCPG
jgi:ferredoxin